MNLRLARFTILWVSLILFSNSVKGYTDSDGNKLAITISETISEITCLGNADGAIDITVSGGVGPYTFSWSNGATSQNISNLAPGDYTVTVTDTGDGNKTKSETFTIDPGFYVLDGANDNSKDVGCTYDNDGTLNIVITAGHGPYTYEWIDEDGNIVGTSSNVADITAGTYTLNVSGFSNDDVQCFVTETIIVEEPAPIFTVTADITAVGCNGDSDGAIDLTVSSPNNNPPIKYDWLTTGENTQDITVLFAGEYVVKISQGSHCEIHTFTVTQPDPFVLTATPTNLLCNGDNSGSIDLAIAGGTGPFTYVWSNGASSQDLSGLAAGTYDVTVTDTNDCVAFASISITEPAALTLSTTQVNVLCNGNSTGSINLTVSGGTGAYSYLWSNGATTQDLSGLPAGNYSVTVTDDNNCTETASVTITQPAPLALSTTSINVDCNGNSTGSIDLTVTGGTAGYTYSWSNGSSNEDIGSLPVGNYSVTVTDAAGCTASTSVNITQPNILSVSTTQVNVLCNGTNTGSIDLTVAGGTPDYSYLWSNGATTEDISNLAAGTYSVTVTDDNGCTTSTSLTISQPTALALSTTASNVTCNGSGDGTINLSVSGGAGSYTYLWSNGATSQNLSNLGPGTYSVQVTDGNGCIANASATVSEPAVLALSTTKTDVDCNGNSTGDINLTVTGGTAGFTYAWSNGATTQDISGLPAGNYSVTVTDAEGCTASTSVNITEPSVLAVSTTSTNVLCNGGATGSIDLSVSGGTPGYSYLWNTGATTQDLNGVAAGSYSVTVTDARGCTATTSVTITEPPVLSLSTTQVDVTCKGDADGSIDLTASGGTGLYTYSWSNGDIVEDLSGLTAGAYTVTVTDAKGCTASTTVTITEPPTAMTATYTQVNVSCNGGSDASINLTVTNGVGTLDYAWSNGDTSEDLTNITAGTYSVTVTDDLGCITISNIVITEPTALAVSTTKVDVDCNGNTNGSIDLTVTGGTMPYTYSWNSGAITTQDPSGLAAGVYSVVVTDNNGCTINTSVTITEPAPLNIAVSKTDASCNGESDGIIDLTVTGGTGPYTFDWDSGGPVTEDLIGVPAGTYNVEVTDARGCTATTSVVITEPAPITITEVVTDAGCAGGNAGAIDITVAGGNAPYTYNWNSGAFNTEDINNLLFGNYTIVVTDASGCTASKTISVNEDASLVVTPAVTNVDCNGNNTGEIDLTVAGGTAPYTYLWSTSQTSEDINSLVAGTYSVTVTDNVGCQSTVSVTITEPAVLALSTSQVDVVCNGNTTGSANLTVTGGTAPYTYLWGNGATTQDLTGLAAGVYSVLVTDNQGCTATTSVTINEPAALALSAIPTDITCNGANDGEIDLQVTGGTGSYTYSWSNAAISEDLTGLAPGTYTVTVTDAVGCSATTSAIITQPDVLTASTTQLNVLCNGDATGSINVSVSGGTGPYTYVWNNSANTQNLTGLTIGTYSVTITDSKGCTTSTSATITQPALLSLSVSTTDVDCNGDATGAANLTVIGGVGPYTYSWTNGGGTSEDLTNVTAGTYTVTVTDSNGCSESLSATIFEPSAISLSATSVNVLCNGGNTGSIDLSVSGGTVGYSFDWSNGSTAEDPNNLTAGSYTVIVTDSKGCTATTTVTITEPAALTLSDVSSNVTCNGNHDGSIDLSVAGGTGPFTYSWSNGSTSQDLSGLGPGTYSVTVTDASACTATTMISITEPAVLAASAVATNVDCNGNASGSIDLSITGGTGPFTYSWSSGATTEDLNGLTPGTYSVTVTDANGCIVSTSATITEPIPLTVSTTSVNILCNGFATGSIDLTVAGGTTAYSYLWSNGATTQDLNNLVAGTYSVTVTDANLCTATTSVTITQPPAITLTTSQVDITCKGDTDGSIDLSVSGGTGAYSYSWSSGETTQDLSGLAAGSYTVTVTDANGCTANSTITITEPPTLMTATYTQTNVSCNGGSDANIDITVADGTAPISYAWSNGATSEDLTNIPAGSYSVVITDALGCITIKDIVITEPSLLTASATKVDVDCNGNSSGSIDLSVAGGVAPYTYSWSNGASTQDLTNIGGGTYSVVVTDANGCTVNVSSTVVEPAAIVLTQDVTHVSCNGGADGAIDITIAGGRAPYRYAWNSGSTSQDLTNLSAGTYIVTATDYNGCTETLSIQITEPGTALSASVTVTDIACKGENTGAIDLTVTGGTAPYNYAWSSGATTEDVSSLPAGSYDVTITDDNNCITLTGITISEPAAVLALSASNQNVTCNGGNDGFINVTVSGGTTPYSYAWSNGATTQDLNNLTAGNYSLTLTDANGCVETASYTISEPNALTINLSQTDVSCFGEDNGAIDATVSGGTAPYTYNWSNGESTEDISNLVAGNYTLNLVDANGCTSSASVTITEPSELTLSSIVTDAGCNGGTNGAIDLSVLGGTAPYTYSWSNGSTSEDLTGLTFGAYTVTVTDANGCNTDLVVNVNEDASFFVNPNLTNVSCNNGNDGAVDLDVTGGLAPFSFSWSNGATTEDINGLTAGVYTVTIVDANGCTSISQVEITEPDEISTLISSTDIQCNGSTDGTLTLDLQGGTAPYGITVNVIPGTGIQATVTDSNGCSPVVFGIESTATGFPATATASISGSQLVVGNLGAGTYDITRPDLGGTLIGSEIINEPASLSILATTTDVSCNGGNDGAIDLSVTGGIGNYTYSWSNDRTTADLGSLASGSYTVTVSDANGCSTTASFNISEPLPISVSAGIQDVLCYGGSNGRINLSVSGGTGGYTYSWSNGSTASLLNNISAGNYTVLVTDANGCTVQETFEVKQPTQIVLDVDVANLSCFGAGDGSINLSVSGGGGGYTFLWSTGATTEDISGLSAGTYSVTVIDANGCSAQRSILVTEPQVLSMSGSVNQIACFGLNNGDIDITVTGGTAPYSFAWDNGATTEDIANLAPGRYIVRVTDANGCTTGQAFQVTQPTEVIVSVAQQNLLCNGASTGSINLTITGGVGSYRVDWQDGAQGLSRSNLRAGVYEATVFDGNGCAKQIAVNITEPSAIVITPTVTNVGCNGDATGAISISASGGTGPYTYSWSNGSTSTSISQLPSGFYDITVTDANNCTTISSIEVEEPATLVGNVVQTDIIDCDNRRVSQNIAAVIQGGTGPYSYSWGGQPFSSDYETTAFQDGSYDVIVRDANNCEIQINFDVTLPVLGESDLLITGLQDPQGEYTFNIPILFEVEKTDNIISWEWDLGDGTTSNEESFEHTYSAVGQYLVRLTTTDDNGCTLEHELSIVVDLGFEIVMPTAFTPNSDGLNDKLYPEFYGITDLKLVIYNNWGEVVFVSEKIDNGGWNGMVNNEEAPAGGYAYKLYATSVSGISIERAGAFLLVIK